MTPVELMRELGAPFTDTTLLLAMVVFFLLGQLAGAAGLLGLWLLIVILPAFFRYLMEVLEARVSARKLEPPGIELFNWVQNGWTLLPLVVLAAAVWAVGTVADHFAVAAASVLGSLLLLLYPASMAVLAVTHSPLASLHPWAVYTLIRTCGARYLLVPAAASGAAGLLWALERAGLPALVLEFGYVYWFFLTFSLTGAVAARGGAAGLLAEPEAAEPEELMIEAAVGRERAATLDHAYGLLSRGNRDGGIAHIQAYIDRSPSRADDYRWFFEEMLRWEQTDPALYFGQRYLSFLLEANEQVAALKLISRCLVENPRFKPLPNDRDRAAAIAAAHGRDDLVAELQR